MLNWGLSGNIRNTRWLCRCVPSTRLSRRFPPWKKAINWLVGIAQLVENMTTGRDTMALEYEAPSGA